MPGADARRTRNDRWTLLVLVAGVVYVLLVAYVPGFTARSPLFCLTRRCLGLHCPSCGLTRAVACLARLDPLAAVRFNPLVVVAAPFLAALVADTALKALGRRGFLAAVPRPLARATLAVVVAGFAVLFVVRTATWLVPEWNPDGWLIPPPTFPP